MVEDEKSILELARTIIEGFGFTILAASTPEEALRLAEQHSGDIHLLITDVVMPGMNGRELSIRLRSIYPDLKHLRRYSTNAAGRKYIEFVTDPEAYLPMVVVWKNKVPVTPLSKSSEWYKSCFLKRRTMCVLPHRSVTRWTAGTVFKQPSS